MRPAATALVALLTLYGVPSTVAADEPFEKTAAPFLRTYCLDCHGADEPEARLDLSQLVADREFLSRFKDWQRVSRVLMERKMPPAEASQPDDAVRQEVARIVHEEVQQAATRYAGDPGPVLVRRLTAAEYAYTIQDLTGVELELRDDLPGDAVGGEGFANIGTVQFVDEGVLERYLLAAKRVASHAVIGAGPLQYFRDPGLTGQELSAAHRIQEIYRQHGFRTGAGEGAKPFGLDRYPKAFFVAWRFQHRARLGIPDQGLDQLARNEQLEVRLAEHVWDVLHRPSLSSPASEVVNVWRELPEPTGPTDPVIDQVRQQCSEIYKQTRRWQERLAGAVEQQEEAAVLSEDSLELKRSHRFELTVLLREDRAKLPVRFAVVPVDPSQRDRSLVAWRDGKIRFRKRDRRWGKEQPLASVVSELQDHSVRSNGNQGTAEPPPNDFVVASGQQRRFEIRLPPETSAIELTVRAELQVEQGGAGVVRCEIAELGDAATAATAATGKTVSGLLADPSSPAYLAWREGAREFARLLPQVSHREPAPSDRDPIPAPFDNTYNAPERDHFHIKLKYHRDDAFLVKHILDDDARRRLDEAWADLLSSFEYHDLFLRFVAQKFRCELEGRTVATIEAEWIEQLPAAARPHVQRLVEEYRAIQEDMRLAEPGHVDDVLQFAARAWRRPLDAHEQASLRTFYEGLRSGEKLDHASAIRALLARVLVSPAFLYRVERTQQQTGLVALNDWELASRLSYLLWSSIPDEELLEAAAAGELRDAGQLARHARRMLQDPKARRFAAEFFGQWFGFYQFDRYRGVDSDRFPEFTDRLKESLLQEAISFFEHVTCRDRPLREILFADYAFLDDQLARFYGIDASAGQLPGRVEGISEANRGGLLGLGAILTVTSAPLRTSPVKRGDWILRRVLGTPVPPPPADAGSIPADDVLADGRTVRDLLEAHRRSAECANCHARIDPLGMALEHYDAIGRWRVAYRDGGIIDDSGTLADGSRVDGVLGLKNYLRRNQTLFYRNLCTRLLGYALGRGELASDGELISQMMAAVAEGEGTLADVMEVIVASPQFRYRRGTDNRPVEVALVSKGPREEVEDAP